MVDSKDLEQAMEKRPEEGSTRKSIRIYAYSRAGVGLLGDLRFIFYMYVS